MRPPDNPYSVHDLLARRDPMTAYQESFFALIWPSLLFSVAILGSILTLELVTPPDADGKSVIFEISPLATLLTMLTVPFGAYTLTARRLVRSDGMRRSIRHSFLIAMGIISIGFMIVLVTMDLAFGARRLIAKENAITRIAISSSVASGVFVLLLSCIFKLFWPEVRLPRFILVFLATTAPIVLIVFANPSIEEFIKPIMLTFFSGLFAIIAHCNCFSWWCATPWFEREKLQEVSQTDSRNLDATSRPSLPRSFSVGGSERRDFRQRTF